MAASNLISLFRKILPPRHSPVNKQATTVSSSVSISSTAKETFNVSHTSTKKKKKRSPSNPSPLFSPQSSVSSITSTSSSIKDLHDINSSSAIYPWMMTPLPNSAWVFRTGFTPQPDSSAISALYWCHHCDMHIQGTVDHRCEHCNDIFLPDPPSSPILPPKRKRKKWSKSLARLFSN